MTGGYVTGIVILFTLTLAMSWRNERIFRMRMRVLGNIYAYLYSNIQEATSEDIAYAFDALDRISYGEMVWKFWVPVHVWERRLRQEAGLSDSEVS